MKITAFVLCLLAAGSAPAIAQSQLGTGAIAGTVQDSSGASVGQANVTVTNTETGMIRRVDSSAAANYKLDLRVARDFRLTERMTAEVLAEGFNVFNHSNYNGFNTTIYTAAATTNTTPLATPIQLTPTAGYLAPNNDATPPDGTNARRLQLAIRFRF